ncbi:MAG: hypothetical protein QME81_02065 [bacterium]|nr:hypothetical protein [bacterium]
MPYTMEDFKRDYTKDHLNLLTPEEVLPRFSTEDRLQGLSTEDILQRLSLEEIEAYIEKRERRQKHVKK